MSELIDCRNDLTAEMILRAIAKKDNGNVFLGVSGLASFCDTFQAVRDAYVGTIPDAVQLAAQNTMVCGMVDDGVWALLDVFYVFANGDSPNMLLNWVNPGTFDATTVGGPLFTPWEGVTGNGVDEYINLNFSPNPDGINYALNDASIGVYCRLNIQEDGIAIGAFNSPVATDGAFIYPRYTTIADRIVSKLNDNTISQIVNADARGLFIASRDNALDKDIYRNKVQAVQVETSTNVIDVDLFALAGNNAGGGAAEFSTNQVSMAFAGGALTQTDVNNLTDRFETYMDFLGNGVIP